VTLFVEGRMSIQVICPTCDQVHTVKDEAAGKKLRCKGCQAVIPIPAADEVEQADPWDTGELDEPAPRRTLQQAPRRPRKTSAEPKLARRSSRDGMPATIIIALIVNGLLIGFNILAIIGSITMVNNILVLIWSILRILIEAAVIKGLVDRSNRIRWNSIILDAVGLALVLLCFAPAIFLVPDALRQPGVAVGAAAVIAVYVLQSMLWIVDIVVLLSPSARDYCNG
jgi:hypothetical protein